MSPLSKHPVSALEELANAGHIARPVYTGTLLEVGRYRMVVQLPESINAVAVAQNGREAKRRAAEELLRIVMKRMRLCPTPERDRYATEEAAWGEIRRRQALGKGKPLHHVFSCPCGWWHTSGSKKTRMT